MIANYTTIEQSQKLIDAGIDPNTCDMWHHPDWSNHADFDRRCRVENIPCWSMARLMSLLPDEIVIDRGKRTCKHYIFSIEKFEPWQYSFAYYCRNINGDIETLWDEICIDSPLDLLVDALCWVMTNGYEDKQIQREIAENEQL